jgi:DNA-3-methyladenine glycosylase
MRSLRDRLARPALEVAPRLLGAVVSSTVGGVEVAVELTEVEAYEGQDDPASHAYRGRTERTAVMFGPAGHLYCYFSYGMHWCANIVCGADGTAASVLLRAADVLAGQTSAWARRPAARRGPDLARGPARLAACLGLRGEHSGVDLLDPNSPVRLYRVAARRPRGVSNGPRVGITRAADRPWRFWLETQPSVSPYRAGARRPGRSVPAD